MSVWTILWLLWGLAFAVIEGKAVLNDKRDDTLSEHFREWFRTDTKRGRTVWLVVSGLFFAWFTTHIAVEGSI
jgi:dolichol kinase